MLDETRERLIVMGGTTEPGVFQVESRSSGVILHAYETWDAFSDTCKNRNAHPAWIFTKEAQDFLTRHDGKAPTGGLWACCPCNARRID